jgi:ubiquinone/menaquinone biosynthesis C-methylase UbiE
MMTVISTILKILLWIIAIYVGWIVFVEVFVRLIRRFVHFPLPAVITRYLDHPLRKKMQPPAQVIDWVGIQSGMCVLEIGPGPGTFTFEAARRVGATGQLFAVDIQPALIALLDSRLQMYKVTNVTTKVASAYDLPFPDHTFDRVFMVTVSGEIPDKKKALLEIKRVLKDDGLLGTGEFLPDLDYPCRRTVIRWCRKAGLELVNGYGGIIHYVLTFKKSTEGI